MPMGPYKDFAACVAAQKKKGKSDKAAHKICGYIKQKTEGEITEEEYNQAIASLWIEESVLNLTQHD